MRKLFQKIVRSAVCWISLVDLFAYYIIYRVFFWIPAAIQEKAKTDLIRRDSWYWKTLHFTFNICVFSKILWFPFGIISDCFIIFIHEFKWGNISMWHISSEKKNHWKWFFLVKIFKTSTHRRLIKTAVWQCETQIRYLVFWYSGSELVKLSPV